MNESIPVAGKEEEERGKLLPFNMMRKHVSWVYNFFKKGLWAIYKIDIMKKVVTLQNGSKWFGFQSHTLSART